MGPKRSRSTVLTPEEEATTAIAFRKHTLLPLDDCLYSLQASIPRSSPHRCFQRNGVSRLQEMKGEARPKKRFKAYTIGSIHIDIAEVRTAEEKLYLFVATDRTSKLTYAELHKTQQRAIAVGFLIRLKRKVPYQIHTVLTDNGIQFANRAQDRWNGRHLFERICARYEIEHRRTRPNHPWANGPVEAAALAASMNRTLKEATVKRYHYASHAELRGHLRTFLLPYNFAKRL